VLAAIGEIDETPEDARAGKIRRQFEGQAEERSLGNDRP
jgi:hypothetical protein